MTPRVPMPTAAIADFCRKWQVTEFALFGSVLRDAFRPRSHQRLVRESTRISISGDVG